MTMDSLSMDLRAEEDENPPIFYPEKPGSKVLSYFEFWPSWLFYAPVKFYYAYLSLRYGSMTLPSLTNPYFEAGGFVGESKTQIMKQIPERIFHLVAEYVTFRRTGEDELSKNADFKNALSLMENEGIRFPVVAKPDIGCRGLGVQRIFNQNDLLKYISIFPANENIILQALYDYPREVGLFYIRHPDWEKGKIFSLTEKYFAYVTGDGISTLKQLIKNHSRMGKISHIYFPRHHERLDFVVPENHHYRVAFAGSHSLGTIFKNGHHLITPKLEETWDRISKEIPEFYFGRFDIRFKNYADLETAKNIKIIEVNGSGAEATHIWDSSTTLRGAYKILAEQYNHIFEIASKNRKRGFKTLSLKEFNYFIDKHYELLKKYPMTH